MYTLTKVIQVTWIKMLLLINYSQIYASWDTQKNKLRFGKNYKNKIIDLKIANGDVLQSESIKTIISFLLKRIFIY